MDLGHGLGQSYSTPAALPAMPIPTQYFVTFNGIPIAGLFLSLFFFFFLSSYLLSVWYPTDIRPNLSRSFFLCPQMPKAFDVFIALGFRNFRVSVSGFERALLDLATSAVFMMSRKGPLVHHDMDARHASLVQDFLVLQNEYAALKERLQAVKTRKATLSAEVRFMRRRLKKLKQNSSYLKQNEASEIPQLKPLASHNGSVAGPSFPSLKNDPFDFNESTMKEPNGNVGLASALKTSGFTSKADPFGTELAGKRKISWQDHISLECN